MMKYAEPRPYIWTIIKGTVRDYISHHLALERIAIRNKNSELRFVFKMIVLFTIKQSTLLGPKRQT